MNKQRMSNILSSVQMNPRDRKDLVNAITNSGSINDNTPIKESIDGTELVPIFDGENKAVSINELVNTNKYTDMMVLSTYENRNLTEEQFIEIRERVNVGATFELRDHEPEGYTTYYSLGKRWTDAPAEMYLFNIENYTSNKDVSECGGIFFMAANVNNQYMFVRSYLEETPTNVPVLRTPKFYYTGDGSKFLSDDGNYITIIELYLTNDVEGNKTAISGLSLTKDYTCQLALTNKTLLGTYYNGTFMAFSEGKIVRYNIDSEGNVTLDLSIDPFALEARIAALENPTTE